MVHELLRWMDSHFDHDLTDIVISATVIDRGVGLAFSIPQLQRYSKFQRPVAMLLSTGFAKYYRHSTWFEIARNQAYSHVVTQFGPVTLAELPELRSAIVASINNIQRELDGP
jgi:hypothetical protein